MQWSKLSACYYPTTVLLVDDKKTFANDMQRWLSKNTPCKIFTNPKRLLEYIENQYVLDPFVNRCLTYDEDSHLDHISSDVDIRSIHREIYNDERFKQISVLVIDYAMPYMNGLECCERIGDDKYINKILLTGEADNDLAVEAFNRGIINKFIQKSNPNLKAVINQSIQELQMKYFLDLSEKLYSVASLQVSQCLNDPVFTKFFYDLCQKENIIEYYLTDIDGSFLLLDIEGNPKWLVLKSTEDMEEFLELAEMGEAGEEILKAIETKQKIPYFHTEKDLLTPPTEWDKFMHPASKLSGKSDYYYALITDPNAYALDRKKIVSYQHYLNNTTIS